jgi:hypothetical protein
MTTQRTEHNFSSNDIIHLIVNHGLFTEELDVFRENTMEQILVELADNLRLDSLSSQIKFINVRTSDMSRDRTITVEELGLIDGDTLMIDDASPDATIVSYFWLVNNTLYRISKECSKGRKNFHELSLAFSNSLWGHSVTFYLGYSNLRDIVEPWFWMPDYIGNTNSFTDGKKAVLIVNERTGKCALPSEFDTLISDFVGSETEPGRLFVILEDNDVSGMHLDSFSFGE